MRRRMRLKRRSGANHTRLCTTGLHYMHRIPLLVFAVVVAMASFAAGQVRASRYLFVWAGDADGRESDFLAVVDVNPQSKSYRSVIATRPVDARGTRPHHTEYEMPTGGILWANGFAAGRTFLF